MRIKSKLDKIRKECGSAVAEFYTIREYTMTAIKTRGITTPPLQLLDSLLTQVKNVNKKCGLNTKKVVEKIKKARQHVEKEFERGYGAPPLSAGWDDWDAAYELIDNTGDLIRFSFD